MVLEERGVLEGVLKQSYKKSRISLNDSTKNSWISSKIAQKKLWILSIGHRKNLGILAKASWKKNSEFCWSIAGKLHISSNEYGKRLQILSNDSGKKNHKYCQTVAEKITNFDKGSQGEKSEFCWSIAGKLQISMNMKEDHKFYLTIAGKKTHEFHKWLQKKNHKFSQTITHKIKQSWNFVSW